MDHYSAVNPPKASQEDNHAGNKYDDEKLESDSNVTAAHMENSILGEPLSASWRKEPLNTDEAIKVSQILQACKDKDTQRLITLAATEGGFVEDEVRRLACM